MATTAITKAPVKPRTGTIREIIFRWEGKSKEGKIVGGEMRGATETVVISQLRRQGVTNIKVTKLRMNKGRKITEKDITLFTRQLATMLRSGVPLLQAFEIVGRGHTNPSVGRMIMDIRADVEAGNSLAAGFKKFPLQFDALYCNLVEAGEQAGILDSLLERLAAYKEKMLAIKSKIKSALFYPVAVIIVAVLITAVIMIFVIPAFKSIFESFGAELPLPTQIVIAMSDFFINYFYLVFGIPIALIFWFFYTWKRSEAMQIAMDRFLLKVPIFGELVRKSSIARWNRTLSTMFAAGVPLVDSLDSVGGAAGNNVYKVATKGIRNAVSTGTSLTMAVQNSRVFPNMVVQMIAIGEESGTLESMLSKVADFYEQEVDDMVAGLSSLMEPIIMVVLGTVIGGLVVAMYLPIFKLGGVVG
jgi:type IV pilus assembly protein PilC